MRKADVWMSIGGSDFCVIITGPIAQRGAEVYVNDAESPDETLSDPNLRGMGWAEALSYITGNIIYHVADIALKEGLEDE